MKLKMGIIHVEKQEIWEAKRRLTPQEAAALHKDLRTAAIGWHRTITSQERAELWNDGKGIDHPNVIEGEYEEVKQCRALPGS
jgi:hypothetical protein